jgi:dolichyl-phosphate beta-glucosyltransferase
MVIEVIIPAYNEEKRIGATLERIYTYASASGLDLRVTVVEDGSRDRTPEIVEGLQARFPSLKLLRLERNRGKGAAVRAGMMAASEEADFLLLSDADLATPIEEIEWLLPHAEHTAVVIGSRALDRTLIQVHQPAHREFMGIVYNLFVQAFLLPGLWDTQCGFKLFRAAAAKEIFRDCRTDGFSYDVEALRLAVKRGYVVEEIPVRWFHVGESKVRLASAPWAMFVELLTISRRLGKGPRVSRSCAGAGFPRRIPS